MQETITHDQSCIDQETGFTCAGCQEHSCDYGNYSSQTGETYCDACREDDSQYLSTVVYFSPENDAPIKFYLGDYFSFDEWGDDLPSNITRTYIKTDAWRGYYQTTIKDTVEINSGADLWGEQTDIRNLAERIQEAQEDGSLPCEVYVACDLTSNVFATALTVLVPKNQIDTFNAWIGE
jgi:hypothetical protein